MSDTDDCDYDEDYDMEAYEHDDDDSPLTTDPEDSKAVKHGDEDQDDGEEDADGGDMTWDDDDLTALVASTYALDEVTQEMVQEAVALAQTHLADPDVIQLTPLGPKFTLSVVDMHPATRQACGLTQADPLFLLLNVTNGYKRNSPHARITVSHGVDGQPSTSSERPNPRFSIGIQLVSSVQKFIQERWSRKDETFLVDLYTLAVERLTNCGNVCMLCDRQLPFPGLKPTICEDKLCSYQLEKLGIGAGLGLIDTDIAVADFLICACLAAASSGSRIPFALPSMPTAEGMDDTILPGRIVKALSVTPVLVELPKDDDARSNALKELDPLLETIIRWIFATNRAHVVSMPEDEQFTEMTTGHQFRISTSTRAHASAFESMKQRHGSFFAWHGSSAANWHNILRNNLKNASNTPMMSAGAAYGPGIYLAKNSSTSMSYSGGFGHGGVAGQSRFWNSQFESNLRILALCEVANSPQVQIHHTSGIITCSEETCVTLRYLFLYTTQAMPAIDAEKLTPKLYRNETTIVGMVPISEVDPKYLLVTSDNYAWDIQELVLLIESKHGVFTNGYTRLGFNAQDVKAIITHPSGEGLRLSKLESDNAALRKKIPAYIFTKLHAVGRICVAQVGEDYSQSTEAIVELKSYLEHMPPEIKDALEKAPFEVTDTHSRLPFRDTIMHELELVTSAGDCIHRFGDFLMQVRP
ncbi:hypothetical protein CALVIDRAFT_602424 [Calocera viscosa TUFC12733]|uniref:PARP catalytic domain-containing protein n=1 Tax=Calocera viscosa (strain TUFC12733) TaxID=1330018 RepID=A0A167H348_CALVF|nr:hypothetical protein CALVIDRAFT_602424 [Calocera viscosa TUFC12733]